MKEVREERGWAYSIRSGVDQYQDVGDVMIGAGLPKGKLNEAVGLIVDICGGLAGENQWMIKDEELKVAKDTFRGRLSLAFDVPEEVLGSALEDLMFEGLIHTPDEILKKIDGVSMEEVRKVAELIFKKENMSIAVVGNYKKLELPI
jgi:predicted Zn-dependent peptidase